jgi:YmgG-like glycine-zipper protein
MSRLLRFLPLVALLPVAACVTVPTGPSVMAMPGTGKSFDQFRADDFDCRQYAYNQSGGQTANDAAVDSGVRSAAVGTAVGALAGAAFGGSQGAAAGAGVGLLAGGAYGASASQYSAYGTQRRYDNAYVQCMYMKGEKVPVPGGMMYRSGQPYSPPPYGNAPPPNYGNAPPAPPDAVR